MNNEDCEEAKLMGNLLLFCRETKVKSTKPIFHVDHMVFNMLWLRYFLVFNYMFSCKHNNITLNIKHVICVTFWPLRS